MSLQEKILKRKLKKKEKQKLKIIEEQKKAKEEPTGTLKNLSFTQIVY